MIYIELCIVNIIWKICIYKHIFKWRYFCKYEFNWSKIL